MEGNTFSPEIAGVGTHQIYYTIEDDNNCTQIISKDVIVHDLPVVDFGFDGDVIYTDDASSIILNAGTGFMSYKWHNNYSQQSFDVQNVGNYNVEVTDFNNCKSVTEIKIVDLSSASKDVTIEEIISPISSCEFTNAEDVTVKIKNCYPSDISAGEIINIRYKINSQTTVSEDITLAEDLSHNETINYTFTQKADLSIPASYSFLFNISLSGDGNSLNNFKTINIINYGNLVVDFSGLDNEYCSSNEAVILTPTLIGGYFTGNGIKDNVFNPSLVADGTHTIEYIYNNNTCTAQAIKQVTVYDIPDFDFTGLDESYCLGENTVTLTGNPESGTFSGNGIDVNNFDPNIAGIGIHNITYDYTDANTCNYTITKAVNIYAPSYVEIIGLEDEYCINGEDDILQALPEGGVFSGNGIDNNTFKPSETTAGEHEIIYTLIDFNNCESIATKTVNVHALPVIDFDLDNEICINHETIILNPTIANGIFTGDGIADSYQFNPQIAGIGETNIQYTYVDENHCISEVQKTTNIIDVGEVDFENLETNYCINDGFSTLTPSIIGGSFEGEGIINGDEFHPDQATVGAKNITYTVTDANNCPIKVIKNTVVFDLPNIKFENLESDYCADAQGFIVKTNYLGGTLSGTGIAGTGFHPSIAGVGTHIITYTYQDENNCEKQISKEVIIHAIPDAGFNNLEEKYCENDNAVILSANISGGDFYGNGIDYQTFSPQIAGVGTHIIEYIYTNEFSCSNSFSQNTTVYAKPNAQFRNLTDTYCLSETEVNLEVLPVGGIFEGNGVNIDIFNPNIAGVGIHSVKYTYEKTYSDEFSCSDVVSKSFIVNDVPNISFTGLESEYCPNAEKTYLTANLTGGIFSGEGIYSNEFDPIQAGEGTHEISYNIITEDNCIANYTQSTTVLPKQEIVIDIASDLCINETSIELSIEISNYIYSGNGILGNTFNPNIAGVGTHLINCHYQENNCDFVVSKYITVHDLPEVNFDNLDNEYCINANEITLHGNYENANFMVDGNIELTDSIFNPIDFNVGIHDVSYIYTDNNSCTNQQTKQVVINPLPTLEFVNLEDEYCKNANAVILQSNFEGGLFEGDGVIENIFYPNLVNGNTTIISYTYINEKSCSKTISKEIIILPILDINLNNLEDEYCANDNEINLTASVEGGYFTGNGIVGNKFYPNTLVAGEYEINYRLINENQCISKVAKTINILDIPSLSFDNLENNYCQNGDSIILKGNFENAVFSGEAVINDTILNIPNLSIGNYMITYQYTDENNCSNTITKNITINPIPEANFEGLETEYCENSSSIILEPIQNGGIFKIDNDNLLVNNIFNPNNLEIGEHEITYTISSGSCTNTETKSLIIHALPEINFLNLEENYCLNQEELILKTSHFGGVFEGVLNTITNDSIFKPVISGEQEIFYTYTDTNNCLTKINQNVNIFNLTDVDFEPLDENYCAYNIEITLESNRESTFEGAGVVENTFNPNLAEAGSNIIKCIYTDDNNCTTTETQDIFINTLPDIHFTNLEEDYCINAESFTLEANEIDATLTGQGIDENNLFIPSDLSAGTYEFIASYTDENICTNTEYKNVTIHDLPVINIDNLEDDYCLGSETYLLNVSHENGTFSGDIAIENYTLEMQNLSAGDYEIIYTYEDEFSCENNFSKTITINALTEIDFTGLDESYCMTNEVFTLEPSPIDSENTGIFTGNGINENIFSPSLSGAGTFNITYTYTDENNCVNSITKSTAVYSLPNIYFTGLDDIYCGNATSVELTANNTEAIFSGDGIENGNKFFPSNLEEGIYEITLSYTDENNCFVQDVQSTEVLEVIKLEDIDFNFDTDYCENHLKQVLTASVPATPIHEDGNFYGEGVSNNFLFPAVAGVGNHEITYVVEQENNCVVSKSITINVNALTPLSFDNLENEYCENIEQVSLNATPFGGVFSGNSVYNDGQYFSPKEAKAGLYPITYIYENEFSCISTIKQNVNVLASPNVNFIGLDEDYCLNSENVTLNAIPIEANFSGDGIIDGNVFSPELSGVGTHEISCTYTDNNQCTNVETKIVEIHILPDVQFTENDTIFCRNTEPYLLNATPFGGYFTGLGIDEDYFNPKDAGVGKHQIKYTYENSGECISFDTMSFEVFPLPKLNLESENVLLNENLVIINPDTSIFEYIWNEIIEDTIFKAEVYDYHTIMINNKITSCSILDSIYVKRPEEYGKLMINAYPNPTNTDGILSISIDQLEEKNVIIQLLNNQGQVLYHKEILDILFYVDKINLRDLSLQTGIYYIRVNYGTESETIRKVVLR